MAGTRRYMTRPQHNAIAAHQQRPRQVDNMSVAICPLQRDARRHRIAQMWIVRCMPVLAEMLFGQTQFAQCMPCLPEYLRASQIALPDHHVQIQQQNDQQTNCGPVHAGNQESAAGQHRRANGQPAQRTVVTLRECRTQLTMAAKRKSYRIELIVITHLKVIDCGRVYLSAEVARSCSSSTLSMSSCSRASATFVLRPRCTVGFDAALDDDGDGEGEGSATSAGTAVSLSLVHFASVAGSAVLWLRILPQIDYYSR